ncbi:MAG TPA: anti-sigma factor antagonist [Streptosporangiaceae bacterium]|nr:anti-sigma factor antagonist [Streptosporangiaceae bacterium]
MLICIARAPEARVRDIANKIGITERATQIIISDLEEARYLTRSRIGRRNVYTINPERPFRHPAEADHEVQGLITMFNGHDEARLSSPAVTLPVVREEAPPMSTDPALSVRVSELAGYAVVTAAGSIDFTTRATLEEHLEQALELTRLAVIVDLTDVEFCDSTGLNTFARIRRQATARGVVVVTAGLRDRVKDVFTMTRLTQAFYAQPDLETAIRWLENGSTSRDRYDPLPAPGGDTPGT